MKRSNLRRDTEKARDWIARSKLATTLRRTKLKPRGRKNAQKRERDFGEKAVWVRRMGCVICGATPSDPHHEKPRSLGGTAKDLVNICRRHHLVRHQIGPTRFNERYGVDLVAEAARIEAEWRKLA